MRGSVKVSSVQKVVQGCQEQGSDSPCDRMAIWDSWLRWLCTSIVLNSEHAQVFVLRSLPLSRSSIKCFLGSMPDTAKCLSRHHSCKDM